VSFYEGRQFQWWRLRWYWPERRAAGKPYKMRLLYTGRTVARQAADIESYGRMLGRDSEMISSLRAENARLRATIEQLTAHQLARKVARDEP
jgi:hypothetical protein